MRRWRILALVLSVLALSGNSLPAAADHNADRHSRMDLLSATPKAAINSDFAFWGNYAALGYY
ncbi:MAG TPA: hypothetical protein VGJ86_23620, partial [Acidimicrobiales bacterium]